MDLFCFNLILIENCTLNIKQFKILNLTLVNSHFNKLKSAIKNGTQVTLRLSSNVVSDFNDERSFLHKLLLTNTKVSRICTGFANDSSPNIKF